MAHLQQPVIGGDLKIVFPSVPRILSVSKNAKHGISLDGGCEEQNSIVGAWGGLSYDFRRSEAIRLQPFARICTKITSGNTRNCTSASLLYCLESQILVSTKPLCLLWCDPCPSLSSCPYFVTSRFKELKNPI